MYAEIEKLLATMTSEIPFKEREDASWFLATLVEKTRIWATYNPTPYSVLPPVLDNIQLSPDDQKELLERIMVVAQENLAKDNLLGMLMFIAGKAKAEAALPILPIFLIANYRELDNKVLFQGLISLENYLGSKSFAEMDSRRIEQIKLMYREIADFFRPASSRNC
jgi:hypothetical protein